MSETYLVKRIEKKVISRTVTAKISAEDLARVKAKAEQGIEPYIVGVTVWDDGDAAPNHLPENDEYQLISEDYDNLDVI